MVFPRKQVTLILEGRKTQARRPAKGDRPPFVVGHSYCMKSSNTGPQVGRVKVTSLERGLLADVSDADALAEGFPSRDEYFAWWRREHGTGPLMDVAVWIVGIAHDKDHHARFLHRDSSHGYTTNPALALPDEGEAVDAETLERFAEDNERRFWRHQNKQRAEVADRLAACRDAEQRLVELRSVRGGLAGEDVRAEFRKLEKLIEHRRRREAA